MNKDLIKQKISEALSASLGKCKCEEPRDCPTCIFMDGSHMKDCGCRRPFRFEENWEDRARKMAQSYARAYGRIVYENAIESSSEYLEMLLNVFRAEKEKRESEIKSALETIDWGEILK